MNRVVLAYTKYLSKLTPEHQQHWYSHLCSKSCKPNADYHNATLYGVWPRNVSVYYAFLFEQEVINRMCKGIGKPPLFSKIYVEENRPKGFHLMLRPTRSKFEEFTLLLDKLVSDNINIDFFKGDIDLFERIKHDDGTFERRNHGTLSLLEKWFTKYYVVPGDPNAIEDELKPLRILRKLRQLPAHSIKEDDYDLRYVKEQDDLIAGVYKCIKLLRMVLMKHPAVQNVKIPSWMHEDKVVLY